MSTPKKQVLTVFIVLFLIVLLLAVEEEEAVAEAPVVEVAIAFSQKKIYVKIIYLLFYSPINFWYVIFS